MIKRVVFRKESKGRGCQGMMITCYDFLLHFGSLEKDRLFMFLEPLSYFVCVCMGVCFQRPEKGRYQIHWHWIKDACELLDMCTRN